MGLPAVSWLRLSPKAGWKLLPSVPFTVYYAYVADRHTKLKWRWQSVPSLRCELKGPEGQGWVSPLSPAVCRWLLQPCWAHDSSASGPGRWRLWRWHQLWLLPCSPACSAETGLSPFLRAFQVHKDPCPAAALPTSSVWERLCWLLSYWAPQAAVPQCGAVAVQVCSRWLCLPAQVATAGLSWLAADPEVLQSEWDSALSGQVLLASPLSFSFFLPLAAFPPQLTHCLPLPSPGCTGTERALPVFREKSGQPWPPHPSAVHKPYPRNKSLYISTYVDFIWIYFNQHSGASGYLATPSLFSWSYSSSQADEALPHCMHNCSLWQ